MRTIILICIYLSLIFLFGCNSPHEQASSFQDMPASNPIQNENKDSQTKSANLNNSQVQATSTDNVKSNIKLQEYLNVRYGFSIKYPSEWSAGEESENGDGKSLYVGNPDVDIRAYASNYLEGISDPYHQKNKNIQLQLQKIKLDNGKESTLIVGKQNTKVLYELAYISKQNVEYHFYANISEKFFQDNEKILLKVAKSMDMPE